MIKVIFVDNNEIKMSKEEFEKLLEETYKRGKEENYEAAYNKGYKDGYCNSHWYSGLNSTTTNPVIQPYFTCNDSADSTNQLSTSNAESRLESADKICRCGTSQTNTITYCKAYEIDNAFKNNP
jgi:hypothetical protein